MSLRTPSTPGGRSSLPQPSGLPHRKSISNLNRPNFTTPANVHANVTTQPAEDEMESLDDAPHSQSPTEYHPGGVEPRKSYLPGPGGGSSGLRRPSYANLSKSMSVASATSSSSRSGTPTSPSIGFGQPSGTLTSPATSVSASSTGNKTPNSARSRTPVGNMTSGFGIPRTPSRSTSAKVLGNSVAGLNVNVPPVPNLARSASNQGSANGTSAAAVDVKTSLSVGDGVSAMGFQGVLRFLGEVEFKAGEWGGIELLGEWKGKGKNDGSVSGVQYFACAPACGIFVPSAKITPLVSQSPAPSLSSTMASSRTTTNHRTSLGTSLANRTRPPSTTPRSPAPTSPSKTASSSSSSATAAAKARAEAKITAGSRASRYINMTAKELTASDRLRALNGDDVGGTGEVAPAGRVSPYKRPTSSASTSSQTGSSRYGGNQTTPKAARARPSMGLPTPSSTSTGGFGARKSLGPSATPRATVKRPPSVLQGDVPPIPQSGRSTPTAEFGKSVAGRMTPSDRRRQSVSDVGGLNTANRAGSPRSSSRQSMRSSMADMSSRAEVDRLKQELDVSEREKIDALRKREEIERERDELIVQREMEFAKSRKLETRVKELEDSVSTARVREEKRESLLKEAADENAKKEADGVDQVTRLRDEIRELMERLAASEIAAASARSSLSTTESEHAEVLQAKSVQLDNLQVEFDRLKQESELERRDLTAQLDQLREAGQALCAVYEDKLADAENLRLNSQERVRELENDVASMRTHSGNANGVLGHDTTDASSRPSDLTLSPGGGASVAEVIDNENLRADNEHLRGRIHKLEEQLDDSRAALESEIKRSGRKKQEAGEFETKLRGEIKSLKDNLDRAAGAENKLVDRIAELEAALSESRNTLEKERAETEDLRADAQSGVGVGLTEDLKRAQKEVETIRNERDEARAEVQGLKSKLESSLKEKEELDALEAEIASLQKQQSDSDRGSKKGSTSSNGDNGAMEERTKEMERHRRELDVRDEEIRTLRARLSSPPLHTLSSLPPNNDTNGSSLSPSPVQPHRPNRDSSASNSSKRSLTNTPVKDEVSGLNQQILGLKVLITQLEEENRDLGSQNRNLTGELEALRDSQRALEATIENLMRDMDSGKPSGSSQLHRKPSLVSRSSDAEVVDLKSKLTEVEKKSNREIKALNQEVSNLEALVELKIFREDEMETELQRMRDLLERARSKGFLEGSSSSSDDTHSLRSSMHDRSSTRETTHSVATSQSAGEYADEECELCGEKGHDLENCPIFSGSSPSLSAKPRVPEPGREEEEFCDDCETYGHSLDNCPLVNEIY